MTATEPDDPAAGERREADAIDGSTRPVAALRPRLEFSLQVPGEPIAPGGHASVRLRIRNIDDMPSRYRLTLDGFPAGWALFNPLTEQVTPGATCSQVILLHPERHPDFPPGPHTLYLRVEPQRAPQAAREQEFTLQLLPGSGFGMALAQDGDALQLLLQNHGNAPLPIQLGALAQAQAVAPALPSEPLTLAAGEQRSIPLRLRTGNRPLFGRRRTLEFTVEANSLDEAGFMVALPARLAIVPWLDWRIVPLAFALLLALILALFATQPVSPVILDFHASNPVLARGETLELDWQVNDATSLQLSLDGQQLELPADAPLTGHSLDTTALAGEVTLQLEARNGELSASKSLTVTVHEPLRIDSFSATPETLLRHVVQTLALRWEVSGAQQVRIDGLAQATNHQVEVDSSSDGVEGLPVLVDGHLTLTLIAADGYGTVLEQTLTIPARAATCTVTQTALPLRADPQADAASLAQPEPERNVEVDGRDPSGAWLHLQVDEISGWGLLEGLSCADFTPEDLRILRPGLG